MRLNKKEAFSEAVMLRLVEIYRLIALIAKKNLRPGSG